MDFALPSQLTEELREYGRFLDKELTPFVKEWRRSGTIPRSFLAALGERGWLGADLGGNDVRLHSALRQSELARELGVRCPGVGVAVLVHAGLGVRGLALYGSDRQREIYLRPAALGKVLMSLGNTETGAGSDAAAIETRADKVDGGWRLNGSKAYVTSGTLSDVSLITALTEAEGERTRRASLFLVDLDSPGVTRKKLDKRVWLPSDLSRLTFEDVFVPDENLLGARGEGYVLTLKMFAESRVIISGLTLGTAEGAFELGVGHARRRKVFGRRVIDFQAKSFEAADLYARLEAARLALHKACWAKDNGRDFRLESSVAKYLAVAIAREISGWAADLFGAAAVMHDHPIHNFPMDAWASSIGEGTQDIQKLVIFREIMREREEPSAQ